MKDTPAPRARPRERALAFYCDVLGFEVMQRWGDHPAFISACG